MKTGLALLMMIGVTQAAPNKTIPTQAEWYADITAHPCTAGQPYIQNSLRSLLLTKRLPVIIKSFRVSPIVLLQSGINPKNVDFVCFVTYLESAEFSVTFWRLVACARSRLARVL